MPTGSTLNARKLARVYGMAGALIDELHHGDLDAPSRDRLERLTRESLIEMGSAIPDDLLEELRRLVPPGHGATATEAELRVLWAQMMGWIAGVSLGEQLEAAQDEVWEQERARVNAAPAPSSALERTPSPYL